MDKFTKLTGVAAPMPRVNVDTDAIIPKQYLKTIKRTGLKAGLFYEWRTNQDGSEKPDFVLNKPAYKKARILVADLAEAGLVAIHQPGGDENAGGQPDVTLLERVLSGLRKL